MRPQGVDGTRERGLRKVVIYRKLFTLPFTLSTHYANVFSDRSHKMFMPLFVKKS
jgi:hypothetical protein